MCMLDLRQTKAYIKKNADSAYTFKVMEILDSGHIFPTFYKLQSSVVSVTIIF